ncbi:MAG: response regulator [Coriobacteriia bacterium]|nr:response regulator [Coriobacteriia bacterium]
MKRTAPHKGTVLIVEDSQTLRQMTQMTLEERGYTCLTASDGATALQTLAETIPDIVVLDINLPDIDGFEVCKRIKTDPRTRYVPVIMATGLGRSGFEIMSIESGADDFVAKPIDPLVLDARIEMVIRRMRRERFANALTGLPANALTEERLGFLLARRKPFGVAFFDIDGFRAFNSRYGHARGDLLIRHLAEILMEASNFAECAECFIGHLGGDDFVVTCDPEKVEDIAQHAVAAFDGSVMDFFEDDDREAGGFWLTDRAGEKHWHGPLTLSAAAIPVIERFPASVIELMDQGRDLLGYAKQQPGSFVAVERRGIALG